MLHWCALSPVWVSIMPVQVGGGDESAAAHAAYIRTFSGVDPQIVLKFAGYGESFCTDLAFVRTFSSVNPHMGGQAGGFGVAVGIRT